MKRLFRRHPVLVSAFVLAVAVSLFLAGRLATRAIYWSRHRQEVIEPWMTPGYVGRSWGVDPHELDQRAGLPDRAPGRPLTLEQIAAEEGVPVARIIDRVTAAVAEMTAEQAPRP